MPTYLSLRETSARLPDRPHINTVRRWMTSGCNGVKLRSVRFGGKRLTTEQWCGEFVEAVMAKNGHKSEHLSADAMLDAIGV